MVSRIFLNRKVNKRAGPVTALVVLLFQTKTFHKMGEQNITPCGFRIFVEIEKILNNHNQTKTIKN